MNIVYYIPPFGIYRLHAVMVSCMVEQVVCVLPRWAAAATTILRWEIKVRRRTRTLEHLQQRLAVGSWIRLIELSAVISDISLYDIRYYQLFWIYLGWPLKFWINKWSISSISFGRSVKLRLVVLGGGNLVWHLFLLKRSQKLIQKGGKQARLLKKPVQVKLQLLVLLAQAL